VDREEHWDDYIILQIYVATAVHLLPWLYCWEGKCHAYRGFPIYNGKGLVQLLLIHIGNPAFLKHDISCCRLCTLMPCETGPTEFVYYWLHRLLHCHSLYAVSILLFSSPPCVDLPTTAAHTRCRSTARDYGKALKI
jgi:hypothetical protein